MTSAPATMTASYDYGLVALSVAIAILASYAAIDLAGRVTASKRPLPEMKQTILDCVAACQNGPAPQTTSHLRSAVFCRREYKLEPSPCRNRCPAGESRAARNMAGLVCAPDKIGLHLSRPYPR